MDSSTIFFVMDDLFEKLLILRTPGIGPVKYNALLEKYGDTSAVIDSLNLTQDFKVVLDVANGATYKVAEEVFKKLHFEAKLL